MNGILIKGGTVIDGTGAPRFQADIRVEGGDIVEVGPGLAPRSGERQFDAAGCLVTPGFIESHTHYDGVMWWQPDLDPLPGYGATTVVIGNCGFGTAPVAEDATVREEMAKIFSFFEDMPLRPFLEKLPWSWRSWPEYWETTARTVHNPLNVAAYVGHIPLRLATMGMDAWERAANAEEIAAMARLLDEAMAAGALGLSTNLGDYDIQYRPVPSLKADDAEFDALFDVLAHYPQATVQIALDVFITKTAPDQVDRFSRLVRSRPIRVQMAGGVPLRKFQEGFRDRMVAQHAAHSAAGRDFWVGYEHSAHTFTLGLWKTLVFGQSNIMPWQEVVNLETEEEKRALLADPIWRARARDVWSAYLENGNPPLKEPDTLFLNNSDNDHGPVGISLQRYADESGLHISDALAEWFLANGINSLIEIPPMPLDETLMVTLFRDPRSVGNITDSGAHSQMLCGAGENMHLLAHLARDRGLITIEEAVHVMTGKLADHFFLQDRGVIAPGKRADIAVFRLDEIEKRPLRKAHDVPNGEGRFTWRWTRAPAPMRLTLCNGVPTFDNGAQTDATPGEYVRPSAPALKAAAE
ncbi:N-acyl-D-amino-acid deacylase family protein [Flavisphingomonas formosensis]|uniref:N-acyl-D-amino-acid deacylase family protein n=1 Tax=Flavisphingomonas formosensis TaxID=861534 RepID=UPI0012FB70F1|nr:amidohydrolase family protein [Sphingomonas formosensis]